MEFVIVAFVGLWVALAGVLSYVRLKKDFNEVETNIKEGNKNE